MLNQSKQNSRARRATLKVDSNRPRKRLAAKQAPRRPANRAPKSNPMALALAKAFFSVERRRKLFVSTLVAQRFTEARAIELWSKVEDRGA